MVGTGRGGGRGVVGWLLCAALLAGCPAKHRAAPAVTDAGHDSAPADASPDATDGDAAVPLPEVRSAAVGFFNIPNSMPPYEYGPAIVLENGTYYTFYCGSSATPPHPFDTIWLSTSENGVQWSSPTAALTSGGIYDASSVCDPSVVKFRGAYFMYYTCINVGPPMDADPPDSYHNNRICVAVADHINGPYHRYDHPIIQDLTCPNVGSYCVGQPAAVVMNDKVFVYYTNHRPGDPDPGPGRIFLRKSTDGIHFGDIENGGEPVWPRRNVDVKYDRASKRFFLIQGEVDTVAIPWAASADGIHFSAPSPDRVLATNPDIPMPDGRNHNPGIAADPQGHFSGMTFVAYGSTYATEHTIDWHLYRTNVVLNPATEDCGACAANSCDWSCSVTAGAERRGHCAAPGSADPGLCCACETPPPIPDCSACADGCVAACLSANFEVGSCANPGSSNPSSCCGCD